MPFVFFETKNSRQYVEQKPLSRDIFFSLIPRNPSNIIGIVYYLTPAATFHLHSALFMFTHPTNTHILGHAFTKHTPCAVRSQSAQHRQVKPSQADKQRTCYSLRISSTSLSQQQAASSANSSLRMRLSAECNLRSVCTWHVNAAGDFLLTITAADADLDAPWPFPSMAYGVVVVAMQAIRFGIKMNEG